jgi:DNA-binding NarL/FixJ family response regulator
MIRVFVCDDSEWFAALVEAWLEPHEDLAYVGTADERAGALHALAAARPDVVLLDTMTHGLDPLLVEEVRAAAPGARVVISSGYPLEHATSIVGEADGYVGKDADQSGTIAAIRAAVRPA